MELIVTRNARGDYDFLHVPSSLAYALRELPGFLADEFPASTSRLQQDPYEGLPGKENEERSADWTRLSHPELRHLFDSARELVLADLESLKRERILPPLFRLRIPRENVNAWLSALAAARVGLGEVFRVEPEDLEALPASPVLGRRDRGILLIQLLGWMQGLLLEGESSGLAED